MIELVLPPGNDPSLGKLFDLLTLVDLGGRERTEADPCGGADSGSL